MIFAIIYIITSFLLGFWLINKFLPRIRKSTKNIIRPWFVLIPSAYIVGTLILTTTLYALAYFFTWAKLPNSLAWANTIILLTVLVPNLPKLFKYKQPDYHTTFQQLRQKILNINVMIAVACLGISSALMLHTLSADGQNILLGASVYGDMNTHIAFTRSFSVGQNIPTEYPLFANENIQYHFLFFFLTGNLEFLGFPLAWAINIPSILSFAAFLMLLYTLAALITKSKFAALLTLILFFFRSSYALVSFLLDKGITSLPQAYKIITSNTRYIGNTPKEFWGIWNLNVYINQRHFSFAIALLLFILIALFTTRQLKTSDKQTSD